MGERDAAPDEKWAHRTECGKNDAVQWEREGSYGGLSPDARGGCR